MKHLLGSEIDTSSPKSIHKSIHSFTITDTLRKLNVKKTKQDIAQSVTQDIIVIQSIKTVGELKRVEHNLRKRLKEWAALYYPAETDMAKLAVDITDVKAKDTTSMGATLEKKDAGALQQLAKDLLSCISSQKKQLDYVEKTLKAIAPNLLTLTDPLLAGHFLEHAGSLHKLMLLPGSTIQVIGAEKALFRHMTKGARPPKYGLLFSHELVQKTPKKHQGKVARLLADKICMACKVDYFKGKPVGEQFKKDIIQKIKQLK